MKLSENLSVSSKGIVEGFVDLGNYSRIEDEGAICDHGLVLLFQPFTGEWQEILSDLRSPLGRRMCGRGAYRLCQFLVPVLS